MKKPSEILLEARELLAGGWCQGDNAKDARGESLRWPFVGAKCFCVNGALLSIKGDVPGAEDYISQEAGERYIDWNDHPDRTQLEVVEMVERAALRAMEAGE